MPAVSVGAGEELSAGAVSGMPELVSAEEEGSVFPSGRGFVFVPQPVRGAHNKYEIKQNKSVFFFITILSFFVSAGRKPKVKGGGVLQRNINVGFRSIIRKGNHTGFFVVGKCRFRDAGCSFLVGFVIKDTAA